MRPAAEVARQIYHAGNETHARDVLAELLENDRRAVWRAACLACAKRLRDRAADLLMNWECTIEHAEFGDELNDQAAALERLAEAPELEGKP